MSEVKVDQVVQYHQVFNVDQSWQPIKTLVNVPLQDAIEFAMQEALKTPGQPDLIQIQTTVITNVSA